MSTIRAEAQLTIGKVDNEICLAVRDIYVREDGEIIASATELDGYYHMSIAEAEQLVTTLETLTSATGIQQATAADLKITTLSSKLTSGEGTGRASVKIVPFRGLAMHFTEDEIATLRKLIIMVIETPPQRRWATSTMVMEITDLHGDAASDAHAMSHLFMDIYFSRRANS